MSFGWAYVGCDDIAVTSMAGPTGSILVRSDTYGVSGSENFMLYHEDSPGAPTHKLALTGSFRQTGDYTVTGSVAITGSTFMIGPVEMWSDLRVEGNITANTFDVVSTTRTDIEVSGNTNFGSTINNKHTMTGSFVIAGPRPLNEGEPPCLTVTSSTSTRSFANDNDATHGAVGIGTKQPPTTFAVSGSISYKYDRRIGTTIDLTITSSIVGVKENGPCEVLLPSAHETPGRILIIKDEAGTQPRSSGNKITVTPDGSETIDDQPNYFIMGSRAALSLYSDGIDSWFVF